MLQQCFKIGRGRFNYNQLLARGYAVYFLITPHKVNYVK